MLKQRLFHYVEGMLLKVHLDELTSILTDLKNVDVKIDDEDLSLILLVFFHPYMGILYIRLLLEHILSIMEEIHLRLDSRELHHKAFGNGSYNQSVGLSVVNEDKERGRNRGGDKGKWSWKGKGRSRSKTKGSKGNSNDRCRH